MTSLIKNYYLFRLVSDAFCAYRRRDRWDPLLEKVLSTVNAVNTERGLEAGRALTRFFRQRDWKMGEMLGRGTTSRVFETADKTGCFALKLLRFSELKPAEPGQGESLGVGLRHPNLLAPTQILYFDGWKVCDDGKGEMVGAVMPICGGVDLSEAMAKRRYSLTETAQIGAQICRALRYLHQHGVVHCDLNLQHLREVDALKALI